MCAALAGRPCSAWAGLAAQGRSLRAAQGNGLAALPASGAPLVDSAGMPAPVPLALLAGQGLVTDLLDAREPAIERTEGGLLLPPGIRLALPGLADQLVPPLPDDLRRCGGPPRPGWPSAGASWCR
jgi:hypothetical protein